MLDNLDCRGKRPAVTGWAAALVLMATLATMATAAGPVYWDWPASYSFAELDLAGAAIDSDGYLVPGMAVRDLGPLGPEVIWKAVADASGGYYLATGHGGEVHHLTANGKSSLLASLDDTEIFSLLVLPGGDVLAGGGGDGNLFRIDQTGHSELVGTVPGGYVWSMSLASQKNWVWLGTGSPAALYRYNTESGDLVEEQQLPAANAVSVLGRANGSVLIGTQGPGRIYRYRLGQQLELLSETAQDEATRFVSGPGGAVFVLAVETEPENGASSTSRSRGTPPSAPAALVMLLEQNQTEEIAPAALYRVGADDVVSLWWQGDQDLMAVVWSPRSGWVAGGGLADDDGHARLFGLTPPRGVHTVARWSGGDVLDILLPSKPEGDWLVCESHPGGVHALNERGGQDRVALSQPLDGGGPLHWGRLSWQGRGKSGHPQWSVRGGHSSQPDESWSDWTDSWSDSDHALDLPRFRFVQWRVVLPARSQWQITNVSVSGWQENMSPVITNFRLESLQGVRLGGMLNGADNITQKFSDGLQAEFSRDMEVDRWAGPDRGALGRAVRIFSWQGEDPNGDRLLYRLDYRRRGEDAWHPVDARRPGVYETRETLVGWNTTEVPDGVYDLRLTASDSPDNPARLARQTYQSLGPVRVDNVAPEIARFRLEKTARGFSLRCLVEDQGSVLGGARLLLPNGTYERLDPVDRICDSRREEFATDVIWPREGVAAGPKPWRIRVETRDVRGNRATAEGFVR